MAKVEAKKLVIGEVRFSYANVFIPTAPATGGDVKYNVSILVPKKNKALVAKIKDAIDEMVEEVKVNNKGKLPPKFALPLRDGDTEKPDDEAYEGMYYLSAKSARKPGIVDANLDPIMDQDEFYSGCYGRASVNLFVYDTVGNGIAVGLNNLQKLKEGDRLAGSSSAASDFGDTGEDLM